jgi:hypothetical protein
MSHPENTLSVGVISEGAHDLRSDTYFKSVLLGLIQDSYLRSGTFTQFAADVLRVIACVVIVPVAFTEGFLSSYLSIERVVEEADGRVKIIPKLDAGVEGMIRDVDEITAQVDASAVYNPVVRATLDSVHQTSDGTLTWDIDSLTRMDDAELMGVLRQMQAESERVTDDEEEARDQATDYVRAKIATIRRNVGLFQAQLKAMDAGPGAPADPLHDMA